MKKILCFIIVLCISGCSNTIKHDRSEPTIKKKCNQNNQKMYYDGGIDEEIDNSAKWHGGSWKQMFKWYGF